MFISHALVGACATLIHFGKTTTCKIWERTPQSLVALSRSRCSAVMPVQYDIRFNAIRHIWIPSLFSQPAAPQVETDANQTTSRHVAATPESNRHVSTNSSNQSKIIRPRLTAGECSSSWDRAGDRPAKVKLLRPHGQVATPSKPLAKKVVHSKWSTCHATRGRGISQLDFGRSRERQHTARVGEVFDP